jgi:hypothetical protein
MTDLNARSMSRIELINCDQPSTRLNRPPVLLPGG